jgi:hypothetical protein
LGFFAWLREGVRRAVLLGFTDAISEIGNRSESEDLGPQLAAALQQGISATHQAPVPAIAGPSGRKRLGKSLAQINQAAGS